MSNNTVRVYGLVNGMEMIGSFVSEDNEKIALKNAMALHVQQGSGPDGAVKLQLIPPTFFSNTTEKGVNVDLYKSNILFTYDLRDDIYQEYCKLTGSIILANSLIK